MSARSGVYNTCWPNIPGEETGGRTYLYVLGPGPPTGEASLVTSTCLGSLGGIPDWDFCRDPWLGSLAMILSWDPWMGSLAMILGWDSWL